MQLKRWKMVVSAVACVLMSAQSAYAADPSKESNQYEGPLGEQLQEYWAVDRDLPAVKGRLYTRDGKVHVGVYGGLMSSEPFYWYVPVGARVGYYFSDFFGLELGGQYLLANTTELTDALNEIRGDSFDVTLHGQDKFLWRANVVATWHPLYGKLALLQRKLSHIDLKLQAGVGVSGLERPTPRRDAVESTVAPELVLGGGLSIFLSEMVTLRLDGRGYVGLSPAFELNIEGEDQVRGFGSRLNFPVEFLVGLDFAF
jgi:outer membrane beta-barrel protein